MEHIGSLYKGIEFKSLQQHKKKDFSLSTSANFSHNKNEVIELGAEALLQTRRMELNRI
jgi:hypothetical protein